MIHAGLVGVLLLGLKDARVPEMVVVRKVRGLRASGVSRPGDVVVLDFFVEGRYLVVDAVDNDLRLPQHCIFSLRLR